MLSQARWAGAAVAAIRAIWEAIEAWRATRRLLGADDAMLSDIGVARCNIDWLVHHGRLPTTRHPGESRGPLNR